MRITRSAIAVSSCLAAAVVSLAFAASAFAQGVPVQPGNATVDDFLPSSGCGCHGSLVEQWQPSMHAQAITDPVFLDKLARAEAEAGEEVAAFCKRCHTPIGNMIGDPDGAETEVAGEGVTCMYCHQVVGVEGGVANTSHLLQPDLTRRAQLKDPDAPHPAEYSEFHESAEICGACHNVDHPANGTHLETSYTEWAESPYADEGVVCQDCHMSSDPGTVIGPSTGQAASGAQTRDDIYAMSFVGANVGQGPSDASRALLQSAASMELEMPDIVPAGTAASMTVTITNVGAGHYLPTGLTEVREMWLSVYAEDADGAVTEIGERRFGTIMQDAEGNHPVEMWDAVAIHSDDRIPPRESVSEAYSFEMPEDAERSTVFAELNYRSVPDEMAESAGVDNPTTRMASASRAVFVSQAVKDAEAEEPPADDDEADAAEPDDEADTPEDVGADAGGISGPILALGAVAVLVAAGLVAWAYVRRKRGREPA